MGAIQSAGSLGTSIAPPARWYEHDHSGHVVQFYKEDAAMLNELSRFAATALGAGDAAIVIATNAHREGLAQRLKKSGLNLAGAVKAGRYLAFDAAETLGKFMVGDMPDAARFADVIGAVIMQATRAAATTTTGEQPRVAAFGEMVVLLWEQGNPEAAIKLEQLWNDLAGTHTFHLRCAYPIKDFDRQEHRDLFLKICTEHSGVIPSERYTALVTEEERLRSITELEQKAEALEVETAERIEIQHALGRRESELAEILENAVEGVQQVGPDRKILWANKALMSLLGFSPHEYVNRPLSDFHAHPEVFEEFWRRLMAREDLYDFPADFKCKDGSVKRVLISSNGLWQEGKFVHTRCFVRDVTEVRRMEQVLQKAHEDLEARVQERTWELAKTNEELRLSETSLRQLTGVLLRVQDEERRRMARELHDSTAQAFTALSLNLATAMQYVKPEEQPKVSQALTDGLALADQACREIRTVSYLLHPPLLDDVGLAQALRWFVDGYVARTQIDVDLDVPAGLEGLPGDQATALFRIVQECLTNIHRHSETKLARIRLAKSDNEVTLEVRDYGRGLPAGCELPLDNIPVTPGVGIRGMRERVRQLGGRLEMHSAAPGTRVRVILPLALEN